MECAAMGFLAVIVIGTFIIWILALIDCVTHEFPHENDKIVWVLILVFLGFIGAILYYIVKPTRRTRGRRGRSTLRSRRLRRNSLRAREGENPPSSGGEVHRPES